MSLHAVTSRSYQLQRSCAEASQLRCSHPLGTCPRWPRPRSGGDLRIACGPVWNTSVPRITTSRVGPAWTMNFSKLAEHGAGIGAACFLLSRFLWALTARPSAAHAKGKNEQREAPRCTSAERVVAIKKGIVNAVDKKGGKVQSIGGHEEGNLRCG